MTSISPEQEPDRFQRALKLVTRATAVSVTCAVLLLLIGYGVTRSAANGRMFEEISSVPRREVAIVLGAQVYRDGRLSTIVADRVACGVALFTQRRVEAVLVSGDHGRANYDEVSAMGSALVRAGVPAQRVFLDHAGFRTLDTMQRAHAVFGVRDAVICTQRFHLPRALYLAHSYGIDAVGLVADQRRYQTEVFNAVRESLARVASVLDVTFGRNAYVLGPPISLTDDARVTHDHAL